MKKTLVSIAACVLLAGCKGDRADAGDLEPRIKALESDVSDLRADINRLGSAPTARAVGISGTPGFVLGRLDKKSKTVTRTVISGAFPYASFQQQIDRLLNDGG